MDRTSEIELKDQSTCVNQDARDLLQEQLRVETVQATFLSAFSFATRKQRIVLAISCISALAAGACQVLPTILFGLLAEAFVDVEDPKSGQTPTGIPTSYILGFVWIAIASFCTHCLAIAGFVYIGDAITASIKEQFLISILGQNIGFFDGEGRDALVNNLTGDSDIIREGISQKLSLTVSAVGTLIGTLIVGFVLNARLTGIVIWSVIATFVLAAGANFFAVLHGTRSEAIRYRSVNLVEESLRAIKSVIALTAEKDILLRFAELNRLASKSGYRLRSLVGCVMGSAVAIGYLSVALVLWQGQKSITAQSATFSQVLAIALLFKSAAFGVLGLGAHIESFVKAGSSLSKIMSIIQRSLPQQVPEFDQTRKQAFAGPIVFRHARFIYPTRPSIVIFEDLSLTLAGRKMTTILGASGSGKSTIADILLGFYPLLSGSVSIGGVHMEKFPQELLRQSIRTVQQDPILFEKRTIFENVIIGMEEKRRRSLSRQQQMLSVTKACQIADADTFILRQPQGYDTLIEFGGTNLSGGQRQRIALARALINNPAILILDEATSALDNQTEIRVLENIRAWQQDKFTVIIISHRSMAAKICDEVVVINAGQVVGQGSLDDLVQSKSSPYLQLFAAHDDFKNTGTSSPAFSRPGTTSNDTQSLLRSARSMSSMAPLTRDSVSQERSVPVTLRLSSSVSSPSLRAVVGFIWSICWPERVYAMIGSLASIVAGLEEPISAILLAYASVQLKRSTASAPSGPSIETISLGYLALGLGQCLMFFVQAVTFAHSAEAMVSRTRNLVLERLLSRSIASFDREKNSVSALVKIVFDSCEAMTGISGSILGAMVTGITTIVAAFILGCAFGWKLALVTGATIPIIILSGFWGIYLVDKLKLHIEEHQTISARIGSEAITQIRTVSAFAMEQDVLCRFTSVLALAHKQTLRTNLRLSFIYAATQALFFLCMALGFWYGGTLIYFREYTLFQVVVVYSSIIMSAYSAGVIFSFATDLGKAKSGTADVIQALNSPQRYFNYRLAKSEDRKDIRFDPNLLELNSVYFSYPSRPNSYVLSDINLQASKNAHIVIVGQSGSGKSTLLSLLARFDNPIGGRIKIDGTPVHDIDLGTYRKHVAIVTQEAVLLSGTILENLVLGLDYQPSAESIQQACEEASIWTFIKSLPDGLSTNVGARGGALSGGQRQRLSLTRALLRNAKILLLDEVTSAIDSQTEAGILDALSKVNHNRIIISVSHREEVIKRANWVYVLQNGMICEQGTYTSLMAEEGIFWAINNSTA